MLVSLGGVAQTRRPTVKHDDRVTITPRKIVFPRKPTPVRGFSPGEKTTITYPVITGLRNKTALNRIRAQLQLKNVFGSTVAEYRADEWSWLEELVYTVNYNKDYILDLTFTEFGSAVHGEVNHRHFTIDLRTGNVLKAADVFLPERMDQLGKLVDEKLQQEIKKLREEFLKSGELDAASFDILFNKLKFETANLNDFEVNPTGIIFFKEFRFPHVVRALQPDGRYHFKYAELKPYLRTNGLLWQFVN